MPSARARFLSNRFVIVKSLSVCSPPHITACPITTCCGIEIPPSRCNPLLPSNGNFTNVRLGHLEEKSSDVYEKREKVRGGKFLSTIQTIQAICSDSSVFSVTVSVPDKYLDNWYKVKGNAHTAGLISLVDFFSLI